MGRPASSALFAQSFRHYHPGEHVDEVRFSEPVVITACEILELQGVSQCASVSLTGVSSPQSFPVEIYVRSGGDARFKRLCHPFLYSASASTLQDVQVAVTDHVVLRGTYDSLTLVLYGNLASDIGQLSGNHDLDSSVPLLLPNEASYEVEDLPEALHPHRGKLYAPTSLQYLQLVHIDAEEILVVQQLLQLATIAGRSSLDVKSFYKVIKSLVSAASSLHISETRLQVFPNVRPWAFSAKMTPVDSQERTNRINQILDAKRDLQELHEELDDKRKEKELNTKEVVLTVQEMNNMGNNESVSKAEGSEWVLELILQWIQSGVQPSDLSVPALFPIETLIGGLAAAQLLCTDAKECYRFVVAGGMRLLLDVLQHVVGKFSATALLALGALEFASRHAFGCEALLGWWNPGHSIYEENVDHKGFSTGYAILVNLLLQPQQNSVAQLVARVLHRLRAYELTAGIQSTLETLVESPWRTETFSSLQEDEWESLGKTTVVFKQLVKLLNAKNIEKGDATAQFSQWLMLDVEGVGAMLPPCAAYGGIANSSAHARQDIDPFLLSLLQERRLLSLLAALISSPRFRSKEGHAMNSCMEFVGVLESLLIVLLSCRSGVLFLVGDKEVVLALLTGLQRVQEAQEKDLAPLRHAVALTTAGFLCRPQDIGSMLQTCFSVMSVIDRLLGTSKGSEDLLWALWELSTIARMASGRQALIIIMWFPEVITALVGAINSGPEASAPTLIFGDTWKRAAVHFIAEVFQVVVSDPAASTVAAWIPYAMSIQLALLASLGHVDGAVSIHRGDCGDKDGACCSLLEWLDSAVVYQRKGAVGLLKYTAGIAAGGIGNPQTVGGFSAGESMDLDSNTGDQAGNSDLPSGVMPYPGKWGGIETSAPALSDTAIVQSTVALRILALVSCNLGMAAVLYGEGAIGVVLSILDHCVIALQTSSEYEGVMDEEAEDDGMLDDLGELGKERLVLGLLLPSLLFLLTLLRSLQSAIKNYQNTRLVDVLLSLHHCVSTRTATYASVPPHDWSGITQELIAVRQVLASVLVCWPIFGWTPALFPRLLGTDSSSTVSTSTLLPMEPGRICSVLSLLADMLPQESPQICNSKTALVEFYRSLTVGSILGVQTAAAVNWHAQSPHAEKLLQALSPHIDQISEIVLQYTPAICGVLQGMVKLFMIRLSCKNVDHASVMVRSILKKIREQSVCISTGSEDEILLVERFLQMVAGLALHPATKLILLREGAIDVLVSSSKCQSQSLNGDKVSSTADAEVPTIGWYSSIMRALASFCDPDISMSPSATLSRRLREDCPTFGDCCSIASCLLSLLRVLPIGKELESVLEAFEKLSSHKLGRTAIAYIALQRQAQKSRNEEVNSDSGKFPPVNTDGLSIMVANTNAEGQEDPIFLDLWHRLSSALDSDQYTGVLVTSLIRHSGLLALTLSAAGKSACGLGALKSLFGMCVGPLTESSCDEECQTAVLNIITILRQYTNDEIVNKSTSENINFLSSVSMSAIQEAYTTQMAMLRILKRPETVQELTGKLHETVEKFSLPRTTRGKNSDGATLPVHMRVVTGLVLLTKMDLELEKDVSTSDELLSEKDSESCFVDSRGKLVWECPTLLQDRPVLSVSASKRKTISMIEVGRKRYRMDLPASSIPVAEGTATGGTPSSGRAVSGSAMPVPVLSRRDTFRQRKPNTSRPPSMHVDDYVARERSIDVVPTGSSPAPVQRSTSGSGRPPSIHVDEFIARQQERQHLSANAISHMQLLQTSGRHISLASVDNAKKYLIDGAGKLEEDGQGGSHPSVATPKDNKDNVLRHELSVVESAAVGPSNSTDLLEVSSSAVEDKAEVRSERTPSSASSMSTTVDSIQVNKTPQVSDMLLLQSKVTLQTIVSHTPGGSLSSKVEEVGQVTGSGGDEHVQINDGGKIMITSSSTSGVRGVSVKTKSMIPLLVNLRGPDLQSSPRMSSEEQNYGSTPAASQRTSDFQVGATFQANFRQSSMFSPKRTSDSANSMEVLASSAGDFGGMVHSSHILVRSADSQSSSAALMSTREPGDSLPILDSLSRPINSSTLGRDTRQLITSSVRSARDHDASLAMPLSHNVNETHSSHLLQSPSSSVISHRENNSDVVRSVSTFTPASDPRIASFSDMSSQATDPRPRPLDIQRERKAAESPGPVVPPIPPPPTPWPSIDISQRRQESTLLAALPAMISPRPPPPAYSSLVVPAVPRPSAELIGGLVPLPQAPGTPWAGQFSNARYFDESGVPYNTTGRPSQVHPPLPVGQGPTLHGPIPVVGSLPAPIPPPHSLNGGNISVENRPGMGSNDRRFSVSLQGYSLMSPPPPLQPSSYIQPPVPAGRPSTPHGKSLPANIQTHQQLHMQLQQQSIAQLQRQQLQSRQHPLPQHASSQQLQQQLQGPLPMQIQMPVQVPVPPPLPPPPLPPPLPQRFQPPEPTAMLQQMLASPDAIQALLKDQNKLRELLEQHPKLISLLQEKMNQPSA